MTLADEQLKELDNPSLTDSERILLRCRVAADLIHKGQYEAAREALGELWLGIGQRPPISHLPPAVDAEVMLRCGTLTHLLGNGRNVAGAQEQAKDMLSDAQQKFRAQGMSAKVSETQYELSMCYWWLGQHDEARVVLQAALKPLTDADVELKAKILIRRTIVEVWENRYHEALGILKEAEPVFETANDALKGRWHGQRAIIFMKLATAESRPDYADRAIIEFTAAIYHYEQAKHERYCALALTQAGQAALTLIEEHGAMWRVPESELAKLYQRANELLKETQDAEDIKRLRTSALMVIRRLSGMQLQNRTFSFHGAVHELEARLIEQALQLEGGSITRAARRLGMKRQTLSQMLTMRHRKLFDKRTPPEKRLKSIIKKDA